MKFSIFGCLSLILLSACGSSGSSAPYGSSSGTTASHLQDSSGRTIYEYAFDSTNVSNCTGICLSDWPAVAAGATIEATSGGTVNNAAVGSFVRTDNADHQATYNGKPLYYFISDTSPGQVSGNGVDNFSTVTP